MDISVWMIFSKPPSTAFKNGFRQFFKVYKHNFCSIRGANFILLMLITKYNLISKKSWIIFISIDFNVNYLYIMGYNTWIPATHKFKVLQQWCQINIKVITFHKFGGQGISMKIIWIFLHEGFQGAPSHGINTQ